MIMRECDVGVVPLKAWTGTEDTTFCEVSFCICCHLSLSC